jgi:DDE family transposase
VIRRRRPVGRQGILPFVIELGEDEQVTARAGLPLIIEALRAIRLDDKIDEHLAVGRRDRLYSTLEKLEALVLLIAAGGDRVEDIRILSEDKGLLRLLDRTLPSPDALLDFLGSFDDPDAFSARPADEESFVPPETGALQALGKILDCSVARIAGADANTATIDHDGTIIESHKQEARVAYEGTRGYQPLVAVWAEQDLVVADEFRDANVPGGKDPLSSVKRAFAALPASVTHRFFRGDSADYYQPLLQYLEREQIGFAISADMSPELRAVCTAVGESEWAELDERESEHVHVAEVEFTPGNWPKDAEPLRYAALRFTPRQQELFDSVGRRYHAVVSNRRQLPIDEIARWHRGKAGTIEHVHRTFKDELGAGILPSQRFGANAAWFRINALTYNLLTLLRRHALPERFRRARPKRVRFELFTLPARLVQHQRQITVRVCASPERTDEIVAARRWLLARHAATAPESATLPPPA